MLGGKRNKATENYEGKHAQTNTHMLHVGKTARLGLPKSASPTSIRPKAATTPNTKTHFTQTFLSFPVSTDSA